MLFLMQILDRGRKHVSTSLPYVDNRREAFEAIIFVRVVVGQEDPGEGAVSLADGVRAESEVDGVDVAGRAQTVVGRQCRFGRWTHRPESLRRLRQAPAILRPGGAAVSRSLLFVEELLGLNRLVAN